MKMVSVFFVTLSVVAVAGAAANDALEVDPKPSPT
jgi:hypothetical protein